MNTRTFALILGIVFLAVGALGFVPGALSPTEDNVAVHAMHGRLLGLFPVNVLHSATHLLFGVWGIMAYRSLGGAKTYARVVAVAYGLLAVMGLIPGLNTVFGLIPIYGHDVWLHALIAVAAAYFGFMATDRVAVGQVQTGH